MKTKLLGALIIAALGSPLAMAQYYYGGGAFVDNRASTVGESYARGMSDVIRSQGAANLANSEAAINMTEAVSRDIDNRDKWTDTYFQMRQKNRDYRAAERRPRATQEDWVRYAAAGKPAPLSPSELDTVSGEIKWPRVLARPEFEQNRNQIEALTAKRAAYGDLSWDDYTQMSDLIDQTEEQLKSMVADMPSADYMASKRFLQSLDYENRKPAG